MTRHIPFGAGRRPRRLPAQILHVGCMNQTARGPFQRERVTRGESRTRKSRPGGCGKPASRVHGKKEKNEDEKRSERAGTKSEGHSTVSRSSAG
ncbi:hypothetical protein BDZ89DRAFT_480294 [Hymenopellis radicata]|nr:hypothetical protein BDZ89DRAFT_480294 [Hymenopellis radicata]